MRVSTHDYFAICLLVFNEEQNTYVRSVFRKPESIFPGDFVVPVPWRTNDDRFSPVGIVIGVQVRSYSGMRLFNVAWFD